MIQFILDESDLKFKQENIIYGFYFYRSNMPFHAKLIYILEKIRQKYTQSDFYAIDVEQFRSVCLRFNVSSVPTLVIFKNSKEIDRIEGSVKTQDFISIFDDICIKSS